MSSGDILVRYGVQTNTQLDSWKVVFTIFSTFLLIYRDQGFLVNHQFSAWKNRNMYIRYEKWKDRMQNRFIFQENWNLSLSCVFWMQNCACENCVILNSWKRGHVLKSAKIFESIALAENLKPRINHWLTS